MARGRLLARGLAPFKCSIRVHCDACEVAGLGLAPGPGQAHPLCSTSLFCSHLTFPGKLFFLRQHSDEQKIEKLRQTSILLSPSTSPTTETQATDNTFPNRFTEVNPLQVRTRLQITEACEFLISCPACRRNK